MVSVSSITYMYTRLKLGWTEKEYTLYSAMSTGLAGLAIAVVIPFLSFKLKVPDGIIGAIGAISGMAGSLVLTFVSASWMMYLGKPVNSRSLTIGVRIIIKFPTKPVFLDSFNPRLRLLSEQSCPKCPRVMSWVAFLQCSLA